MRACQAAAAGREGAAQRRETTRGCVWAQEKKEDTSWITSRGSKKKKKFKKEGEGSQDNYWAGLDVADHLMVERRRAVRGKVPRYLAYHATGYGTGGALTDSK